MDNPAAAAGLNQLLDAEQQSLVLRAAESTPFVSLSEVRAGNLIRAMAQASRQHRAELTEMILDLGGQPVPKRAILLSGNMHYLDLQSMMPRLIEAQESIVSQYRQIAPRLAGDRRATALASRILSHHEAELDKMKNAFQPSATTKG